ncbi:MAG TPA: efflux RND transporter periplasmic adaptor subunit [Candidatus Sulfotelmatobacter sp.]|jgi:RND family efflux transporter MFP subunit|nr:efflux RND transporter periplasmic adaptor subunit [Candidatus Sulfotelmatobacter sp.]
MSDVPGNVPEHVPEHAQDRRRGSAWLYLAGILAVVVAAVMAFLLFTRQRTHVEAATEQLKVETQKGPTVEIAVARKVAGSATLRLIGEARPFQSAIIYAKVSGYMRSISVDKGDYVGANQVVAVIESPETDKQYQAAVADAHNKELIANRATTLVKKEMISQQDADQAEADAAVSKANLEQIGTLKSYEQLRAPFSGTVTARYSDPGALIQNAATSQTSALPLVEISETTRLRIYVYVDQAHAPFVRKGDSVTILDQSQPSFKLEARVTRTSGQIDAKTRTLLVEIDVDNPHNRILAGSFVQVELKVQTPRYVEIPSDALIVRGNQTVVAVVTSDDTVKFTQVAVAEQTGETARLLTGLDEGEHVARNLGERVAEGGKVQPVARP